MIITTIRQKGWKKAGRYYYQSGSRTKKIAKGNRLLLFKGILYPGLKLGLHDLFNLFSRSKTGAGAKRLQELARLKEFKGRYCGCFIDKNDNSVVIFNDQLGLSDLFYCCQEPELIVSDSFTGFFKIKKFYKKDIDAAAVAEFLAYEYPFLDRTFVKSIKLLPYASAKRFGFKGKSQAIDGCAFQYWRFERAEGKNFDKAEAFRKLDGLLKQSVRRIKALNPREAFAIGISGGLDSRLVAKYALGAGIRLKPFVVSEKGSDAFLIAGRVAKALNLSLAEIEVKKDFWKASQQHLSCDPLLNLLYTPYGSLGKELPKARLILTGFNGDNLFGSHIGNIDFDKRLGIVEKIKKKCALAPESALLSCGQISLTAQDLKKYESLALEHWKAIEMFDFENRQLRFVKNSSFFTYCGAYEQALSIFADIDVVEFGLALPLGELVNCRFYHDFINAYFPGLARIRPERKAYSLKDNKLLRAAKQKSLSAKLRFLDRTGIKLPFYRTINYPGMLGWEALYNKNENISLDDELKKASRLAGLQGELAQAVSLDLPGTKGLAALRVKMHYLTVLKFIGEYLKD